MAIAHEPADEGGASFIAENRGRLSLAWPFGSARCTSQGVHTAALRDQSEDMSGA